MLAGARAARRLRAAAAAVLGPPAAHAAAAARALPPAALAEPAAWTVVLAGEIIEASEVDVTLTPLSDPDKAAVIALDRAASNSGRRDGGDGNGGTAVPSPGRRLRRRPAAGAIYELKVTLSSRERLLADLTATLANLNLDVLGGEIATDGKGRAVDTLRVRDTSGESGSEGEDGGDGGDASLPPSPIRAKTLEGRVRERLREELDVPTPAGRGDHDERPQPQRRPGAQGDAPSASLAAGGERSAARRPRRHARPRRAARARRVEDRRAVARLCALPRAAPAAGPRAAGRARARPALCHRALRHRGAQQATRRAARRGVGVVGHRGPRRSAGQRRRVDRRGDELLPAQPPRGRGARRRGPLAAPAAEGARAGRGRVRDGPPRARRAQRPRLRDQVVPLPAGARAAQDRPPILPARARHPPAALEADRQSGSTSRWFVHLVCAGQELDGIKLVMPACLGGELWNLLNEFGAMSEREGRFYIACLVLALQRLHALGIVYRDLKPENVLLRDDGWPMIADFGLSSFIVGDKPLYSLCGTPEFMAPEVIGATGSAGYGAAADWWSLGVLLCQCLTLNTPYVDPQQRPRRTFDNVLRGRVTVPPELDHHRIASEHAANLIDSLLCPDVGRRLGSSRGAARGEIRSHPFFWGLEWERLERRELEPPHVGYTSDRARATTNHAFFAQTSR